MTNCHILILIIKIQYMILLLLKALSNIKIIISFGICIASNTNVMRRVSYCNDDSLVF